MSNSRRRSRCPHEPSRAGRVPPETRPSHSRETTRARARAPIAPGIPGITPASPSRTLPIAAAKSAGFAAVRISLVGAGIEALARLRRRDDRHAHRHRLQNLVLNAAADLQRRHGDPRMLQVRPDIRHAAGDPDIRSGKVEHRPGRVRPDNPQTGRTPRAPAAAASPARQTTPSPRHSGDSS